MKLLTNETRPTSAQVSAAADFLGLTLIRSGPNSWRRTQIEIGTVFVPAFTEAQWRDLGEGPSWQEKYTLDRDVPRVPIMWDPFSSPQVSITFPVTSLLRQGGVKWGGVSLAANDDDTPRESQHTRSTYDYAAFKELGGLGVLFGYDARLHRGVSFREVPYAHEPSATRFVLDLEG